MLAMRVHGLDRNDTRQLILKHRLETTGPELVRHEECREQRDAELGEQHRARHFSVVGPVPDRYVDPHGTARRLEPPAPARFVRVADATMGAEVSDSAGPAVCVQVVGCGADHAPARFDATRHQARIRELADPDDHIESLLDHADEAITEVDLDFEPWLRCSRPKSMRAPTRRTPRGSGAVTADSASAI
jgi:hypothetical protein